MTSNKKLEWIELVSILKQLELDHPNALKIEFAHYNEITNTYALQLVKFFDYPEAYGYNGDSEKHFSIREGHLAPIDFDTLKTQLCMMSYVDED